MWSSNIVGDKLSNSVAHALVVNAIVDHLTVWQEDPLDFICNILVTDVNIFVD